MTFQVLEVSIEVCASLRTLLPVIKRYDLDTHRQIHRAMTSIPNNIAEGNGRHGRDRRYHFSVAEGSARELRVALRVLEVLQVTKRTQVDRSLELLDRVIAMLCRLKRGARP